MQLSVKMPRGPQSMIRAHRFSHTMRRAWVHRVHQVTCASGAHGTSGASGALWMRRVRAWRNVWARGLRHAGCVRERGSRCEPSSAI